MSFSKLYGRQLNTARLPCALAAGATVVCPVEQSDTHTVLTLRALRSAYTQSSDDPGSFLSGSRAAIDGQGGPAPQATREPVGQHLSPVPILRIR